MEPGMLQAHSSHRQFTYKGHTGGAGVLNGVIVDWDVTMPQLTMDLFGTRILRICNGR